MEKRKKTEIDSFQCKLTDADRASTDELLAGRPKKVVLVKWHLLLLFPSFLRRHCVCVQVETKESLLCVPAHWLRER